MVTPTGGQTAVILVAGTMNMAFSAGKQALPDLACLLRSDHLLKGELA